MTTTATTTTDDEANDRTPAARAARGKRARAEVSRSSHGDWSPATDRPSPISTLALQATTRVPELVPIRHGRMAASAFAFFRGAAAVMAADLSSTTSSGLEVQLCGDAHLVNFGGFATPERSLVFDLNDFDETLPGPFEWDVKRLAASLEIAARDRSFDDAMRAGVVAEATRSYRTAIREFASNGNLDNWYKVLDVETIEALWASEASRTAIKRLRRTVTKAENKDRLKARDRLTHVVDGELRFASDPPLLVPARELFSEAEHHILFATIDQALSDYGATLNPDKRHLLSTYRFVDLARKVVGVGSVGTRSWVALLVGRDNDDPLFLQVKEAEASVLEPYLAPSEYENHGQRVVEGQRQIQAASDILLGWQRVDGVDGRPHDYYIRQLWDWKVSADVEVMEANSLIIYGQMCGWALARSHARSGDPIAIGSYLGSGPSLDQAMVRFAATYADQNERDHQALVAAIVSGELSAEPDI